MNIKFFGFKNFLAIINRKKIAFIFVICIVEIAILWIFKRLINGYF